MAQESGIFAENGFEIEFVTFGSSTEQLLEAIATRPPVTRHPPQSSPDPACLAQLGRRGTAPRDCVSGPSRHSPPKC